MDIFDKNMVAVSSQTGLPSRSDIWMTQHKLYEDTLFLLCVLMVEYMVAMGFHCIAIE